MGRLLAFTLIAVSFLASAAPEPKPRVLVHGHRGSRGTRPENTMPAFREGVAAGADVLELDLHLSSDNVLIVSHDPQLDGNRCRDPQGKTLEKPLLIRKLTAAQIATYDCGSVPHPDFPRQVLVPHTPKPRFEELLQWVSTSAPRVQLNVETKMDAPPGEENPDPKFFAATIIDMLRKYRLLDRSILQSFDFRTLTAAKGIEPRLRLSALVEGDRDFCNTTEKLGALIASPYFPLVNAEQMRLCHQKGIQVAPWTVNDHAEWKRLIDLGTDAIITDYPRDLVEYLSTRPR